MPHRVYMRFERCQGWRVSFRDLDRPRVTFRELTFADAGKIELLIERTATRFLLEDRQALECGLRAGLGAVTLQLTEEQYRRLVAPRGGETGAP